jgi:hypothetical protein
MAAIGGVIGMPNDCVVGITGTIINELIETPIVPPGPPDMLVIVMPPDIGLAICIGAATGAGLIIGPMAGMAAIMDIEYRPSHASTESDVSRRVRDAVVRSLFRS